jgi:hypothetical protein
MQQHDLEQLKTWFAGYCRSFYTGNETDDRNIALKEEHTGRVRANIMLLGEAAGLDCSGLLLAEAIALFHDLGRFPQYRPTKPSRTAFRSTTPPWGEKCSGRREPLTN